MEKLEVTFRIVTPLFLGGAKPNEYAELRPPSIKGAMRFWYRAIDPEYKEHEAKIFGGSGKNEGQSKFLLRISGKRRAEQEWRNNDTRLKYFAFPFNMKQKRRYLAAGNEFTLKFIFKNSVQDAFLKRRIIASSWLLGHLGGIGFRSRRGFGTIALQEWKVSKSDWTELQQVKILHKKSSVADWWDSFQNTLIELKNWFPGTHAADHAILGPASRFKFLETPADNSLEALAKAAAIMQNFRKRRDVSDPSSDYHRVKAHVCACDHKAARVGARLAPPITPEKLTTTVDRAAFGLPLSIKYSSLGYRQKKRNGSLLFKPNGEPDTYPTGPTFEGNIHIRSASKIHIRVVKIREQYYPFFIWMDGPLLANSERLKDRWGTYPQPDDTILIDFWNSIQTTKEVAW